MVRYEEFNRQTQISIEQGRMTGSLGEMLLEMSWATTKSYCDKKGIPLITTEEIYGNVLVKVCEKFMDKVDPNQVPYAFAITMIRNFVIDQVRRLNYADQLLGVCTTYVDGEKVKAKIDYIEDLLTNN